MPEKLASVAVACYIVDMTNTADTLIPAETTVEAPVTPKRTVKAGKAAKVKLKKLVCKTKGCKNEIVRTGGRGRPPFNCVEHRNPAPVVVEAPAEA